MDQKEVPGHYTAAEYTGRLDDMIYWNPQNGEQFARTADLAPQISAPVTTVVTPVTTVVTGWTPLRSLEQLLPLLQFFALQIFEPLGWLWRWPLKHRATWASTVSNGKMNARLVPVVNAN